MSLEEIEHISDLIVRKISGELSEKEEKELQEWTNRSDRHQALYARYMSAGFPLSMSTESLHSGQAFEQFCRKVSIRKRQIVFRYIAAGAAAVLLPFLIVCSLLLQPEEPEIQMARQIMPGSSKAILYLHGGKSINLKNIGDSVIIEQNGARIQVDGKQVIYEGGAEIAEFSNTIEVPRGGEYQLVLEDGTKVWFNSESELAYPVKFVGKERRVKASGELYFEVARDSARKFIVETRYGNIEVLGTSFNLRSYGDENYAVTTLVSGRVQIVKDTETMQLLPGEQCISTPQGMSSRSVDTDEITAWKEGQFIFREQCLEHIMQTLARWYNIEVVFADDRLRQYVFNGNIKRYNDLGKILKILEMPGGLSFSVEGRRVTVDKKI